MTTHRSRGLAALSLVEMLVVLAICGTLLALMLPMLARTRASARATVCAENLRGLGQGYTMATVESGGVLADAFYTFDGHDGTYQVAVRGPQSATPDALLNGNMRRSLACPADSTPVCVAGKTMSGSATAVPVSYAYNLSLPLLFRNASRLAAPADTVSFYDGDLTAVAAAPWSFSQNWAQNTVRYRHRGEANFLFVDGHVERMGAFPDVAFAGGLRWLASARDTRPVAPEPVAPASKETPVVSFGLNNGEAIPNEECSVTVMCIGSDIYNGTGGPRIPVQAWYSINNGSKTVVTNDTRGGETSQVNSVHPGDTLVIGGKCMQYISNAYQSNDGKGHCWTLRNGDIVPSLAGYGGQRSVKEFLGSYVDSNGRLTLGENDTLFLFEMSGETDYTRYSWVDFQDLVVMATFGKKTHTISGSLSANPNNSSDNEFLLTLADGTTVTRDDLKNDTPKSGAGFAAGYLEYTGRASAINVKPRGNGTQSSLTVDGSSYALSNSSRCVISSATMTVHLYNDKRNSQGKPTGKWLIAIDATKATLQVMKSSKQTGY